MYQVRHLYQRASIGLKVLTVYRCPLSDGLSDFPEDSDPKNAPDPEAELGRILAFHSIDLCSVVYKGKRWLPSRLVKMLVVSLRFPCIVDVMARLDGRERHTWLSRV